MFEIRGELIRVAGRRKAGLVEADKRERLVSKKMREGLFESACKSRRLSAGSNAQNGFAEAKDTVGGILEHLRSRIIRIACDYDLNRM